MSPLDIALTVIIPSLFIAAAVIVIRRKLKHKNNCGCDCGCDCGNCGSCGNCGKK